MTRRIAALFFCSGMSGLVFEVLWIRSLALWVGHTTIAVSLVVASFLGGLVLGSFAGGRWADRTARPLRLYGILELVVGASALAITLVLAHAGTFSVPWSASLRIVSAFVILLPPTFAMGATLPLLTRFVTSDIAHVGRSFGALYAVNTLGAACGCGIAGFVLIGSIGLMRTAFVAIALDVVVGLVAIAWATRAKPIQPSEKADESFVTKPSSLHAIAFVTGLASIACEIIWFRVLRSFIESSTYAFTLLLVTFLVGLVLGGAIYARRFAGHGDPRALLSDVQILLAFAGLASIAALGASGELFAAVAAPSGFRRALAQVVVAASAILVPATLMGVSYPLVARIGSRDLGRLGRSVGGLAAANTLGGVTGSLATGLLLVPWLGTQLCLSLALALNVIVSIAAGQGIRRRIVAPVVFALGAFALFPRHYLIDAIATNARADRLAVREGKDGTLTVFGFTRASVCRAWKDCQRHCPSDFSYQQLTFGSISYASTLPAGRRYMRSLAHLPLLLRPKATRALEICFGTGTTAGALVTWPSLASLAIVDINADVLAVAPLFAESNHHVLEDPRVRAIVEDGRHFLATEDQTFDVVSLEPPPPTVEGASTLYTSEFYALAKKRMSPGGIIAQWIPFVQQTEALNQSLLRSMLDTFAHVHVYLSSRVEGVVLASDEPMTIDRDAWDAAMHVPAIGANLAEVGFDSPEALLATLVLDTDATKRWVAGAGPVTDDRPSVEYFRSSGGPDWSVESMLRMAIDPRSVSRASDAARLGRRTEAARLHMRAEMARMDGHLEDARTLAEKARTLDETDYAKWLVEMEMDCLGPGDRP